MRRFFKILFITALTIIVLIAGAGFLVAYFYGEEVQNYVITQMNKHIDTEIDVKEVHFSALKKFPNASLEFTDVVMKSTNKFSKKYFPCNTDTFFRAGSLFLEFNLMDIINNNYQIKAIHVKNGKGQIFIDGKGNDNYHFWKVNENTEPSNFSINLQNLVFTDVELVFINNFKRLDFRTYTSDFSLSGNLASNKYALKTKGALMVKRLKMNGVNYITGRNTSVNFNLNVDNNKYSIKRGVLTVSGLKFNVDGDFITGSKTAMNLGIKGKNIDIHSFLSLLPEQYKKKADGFSSKGKFYFETLITGDVSRFSSPHIEAKFGVNDGTIEKESSSIKLTDVYLKGDYTNGSLNHTKTCVLNLDTFSTRFGNNYFTGMVNIQNFTSPHVKLKADASFDLKELQEFLQIENIELIEGDLKSNFYFNGKLQSFNKFTAYDFRNAKTKGRLALSNAQLKMTDSPYLAEDISGGFVFNNNSVRVDSLSLKLDDSDFFVKGELINLLNYLLVDGQSMAINGNIKSQYLNLNHIIKENSDESSTESSFTFPENIIFTTRLEVNDFVYSRFEAKNMQADLNYRDKILRVSNLHLQALDGEIAGNGSIRQLSNNKFMTHTAAGLKGMDIKKLFYCCNNFGQHFIKEDHLEGILTANVNFSSEWSDHFKIDTKRIVAKSSLMIENGELNNFEPMQQLSSYLKVDELEHVKFLTLKNEIVINDENIVIPRMDINSTAFNIQVEGQHSFNNNIAYRLKVLLSDVLANKVRKAKKENSEFGVIEDDGYGRTSIPLSISGTVDNYKIAYDTKQVREAIKENLKKEKETLKTILNEEFGLFKKDSTVIKNKEKAKKEDEEEKLTPSMFQFDEDF